MSKVSRSQTRRYLVEVLYQCALRDADVQEILVRYKKKKRVDIDYLATCVTGIFANKNEIEALISKTLDDRSFAELDIIESCILQIGAYELAYQYDVPYKVVLDECINLAKHFGGQDSHKLVNASLDLIAKEVRKLECDNSSQN